MPRHRLPDLVKDSQLRTAFQSDAGITLHRFTSTDLSGRRVHYEEKWKIDKYLGHGSYGRVWKESCVSTGSEADTAAAKVRAVKMILKPQHASKEFDYNRELEAIAKFSHSKYESCFVKSFGWYESREAIFIAMEFIGFGDLQKYMPSPGESFPIDETQDVVSQVLEGLFYMHENGFAHRDLKPANILVKSKPPDFGKWWVKIGDFGISKRAEDTNGPLTIRGTFGYMAPELLAMANSIEGTGEESLRAQPTDIWGLGEIAFRMIAAKPTFNDILALLRWMQRPSHGFLDPLKPLVPDVVIDFVQCLLKANPDERLSAKQALGHPWIKTTMEVETSDLPSTAEQAWPQDPRSIHSGDTAPSAKWSTLSQSTIADEKTLSETTLRPRVPELKQSDAHRNDDNSNFNKPKSRADLFTATASGEKGILPPSASSVHHSPLDVDQPTVRASPTPRPSTPSAPSRSTSSLKKAVDENSLDPLENRGSHNGHNTDSSIDSENQGPFLKTFARYQPGDKGYYIFPHAVCCARCHGMNPAPEHGTELTCRWCPPSRPKDSVAESGSREFESDPDSDKDRKDFHSYPESIEETPDFDGSPHRTEKPMPSSSSERKPSPYSVNGYPSGAAKLRATEDDARRVGIPAGYSYKYWDPTEEPILLCGSVFDANSLGKWIYDWTVFWYGPATPLAEMAGELWLLLIHLSGKIKLAEGNIKYVRDVGVRETVEDYLESGERLWIRFAKVIRRCEEVMWIAAKKENSGAKPLTMGKESGCDFVDTIFGRDRELEATEMLMTQLRLWSIRFDSNDLISILTKRWRKKGDGKLKFEDLENQAMRYMMRTRETERSTNRSQDADERPDKAAKRPAQRKDTRTRLKEIFAHPVKEPRKRPEERKQPGRTSRNNPDTEREYKIETRVPLTVPPLGRNRT
jgi:serine/threonine protein kinase